MEFRALGPLEVLEAGRPLALGGTKQRAVLALLLLRANAAVPAQALIEAVWGPDPPERARAVLQVYVATLRKVLEPDRGRGVASSRIVTVADGYRLRVEPGESDQDRFYRLLGDAPPLEQDPVGRSARLAEAERLWRGPAFPDLDAGAVPEVARLTEDRMVAVEERIEADLAAGRHLRVVGELAHLVHEQPLRERLRRQRVLALYRSGRQVEALSEYQAAHDELVDELGVEPSPDFQALRLAVLRQDPTLDVPADRPDVAARDVRDEVALPAAPTPLVGRGKQLRELSALLRRPDVRLVTLHGPGGTGKTRLAVAAAAQAHAEGSFPSGVRFVPLAALSDARLVLPAVAAALDLTDTEERSLSAGLRGRLGQQALLLVLDNCEQVVTAAPDIAQLLAEVPALTVLVTSRTTLRLRWEHTYPVPPLSPDEAQALFIARARAARPDFSPSDPTGDVARICQRLDGLPLAIELAAARVRLLSTAGLLARLEHRLPVLANGSHDVPARHQTLRAAIAWSHDLLSPPEQQLFARLAVFGGSCTLTAIETVCCAGLDLDPLDGVQALVDHSLLQVATVDDEPRFSMLQTVREYAGERLAAMPDAAELRRRHAEHQLHLVEALEPRLTAAGQADALQRLELDYDDVRAAVDWARTAPADQLLLRLAGALGHFWEMSSRVDEGRRTLELALAADPEGPPAARAKALTAAGTLACRQGDYSSASEHHRQALELYRQIGDDEGTAFSLNNLAVQAHGQGQHDLAERLLGEAMALTHDGRLRGFVLSNLGEVALARGDQLRATEMHERALRTNIACQDEWAALISTYNLGVAHIHREDPAQAARLLRGGLAHARSLRDLSVVLDFLHGLAALAALTDGDEPAARLLSAVAHLREINDAPASAQDRSLHERALDHLIGRLGAETFWRAWSRGQAYDIDEAIASVALLPAL